MMIIDYRALTLVERRDGFVWLQPQPYGASGTGQSYEAATPFGLMGRPRGPTSDGAPSGIVLRDGPEGFVVATTDPRYQDLLPDTGEGGAGLYACIEQSGTKKTPHVAIFGADGAATEGTIQIVCRSNAGDSTMTWDPTTGDVTASHPGGTTMTLKAASVELGAASGGMPLVKETGTLAAFFAAVVSGFAGLGVTISPPAGYICTKVNGT